jgi:hypothetical protein
MVARSPSLLALLLHLPLALAGVAAALLPALLAAAPAPGAETLQL